TFQGVNVARLRVGAPILADTIARIAKDQAMLWELLTGKTAAGGGGAPASNTAHDHTEAGNKLFWPLASQHFGSAHFRGDGTTDQDHRWPMGIQSVTDAETVQMLPFYVPTAFADEPIDVIFSVSDSADPELTVRLLDSSLSAVAGQS